MKSLGQQFPENVNSNFPSTEKFKCIYKFKKLQKVEVYFDQFTLIFIV